MPRSADGVERRGSGRSRSASAPATRSSTVARATGRRRTGARSSCGRYTRPRSRSSPTSRRKLVSWKATPEVARGPERCGRRAARGSAASSRRSPPPSRPCSRAGRPRSRTTSCRGPSPSTRRNRSKQLGVDVEAPRRCGRPPPAPGRRDRPGREVGAEPARRTPSSARRVSLGATVAEVVDDVVGEPAEARTARTRGGASAPEAAGLDQ